jgi:hemoglobin
VPRLRRSGTLVALSLFDRIGDDKLRAVLETFYDAVFADVMIGFFFRGKDKARLVDKEWELVASHLGAPVRYSGRPLAEAHAAHPILGGHFERRLQLLREAMAAHGVDPDVREAWIAHTIALRPLVTSDRGTDCDHGVTPARRPPE